MKASVPPFRIGSSRMQAVRIGVVIATALLVTGAAAVPALAAAPSSTFRFALPGGAAILYGKASNPQAPLSQRAWQQAVFHFPNGASFSLLPGAGASDSDGTQMEPPSDSNISPSGQYVVVGRIESGTVSSGPGQAESVASREYCSAIEIRTGCITADQTGEICGAGWQAGQPAQWGTDDQTNLMLKDDRPSATRLLHFVSAGQPPRSLIDDDSGAGNLLRCDPPSSANREAYQKIATALHAAGAQNDARLIDDALSKAAGGTPVPSALETGHRAETVSTQKATLYTAPDDAHASPSPEAPIWTVRADRTWLYERPSVGSVRHGYLIHGDQVTVIDTQNSDWARVRYARPGKTPIEAWLQKQDIAR